MEESPCAPVADWGGESCCVLLDWLFELPRWDGGNIGTYRDQVDELGRQIRQSRVAIAGLWGCAAGQTRFGTDSRFNNWLKSEGGMKTAINTYLVNRRRNTVGRWQTEARCK